MSSKHFAGTITCDSSDWEKVTVIRGKEKTLAQKQREGTSASVRKTQPTSYSNGILTKEAANNFDPANIAILPKVTSEFKSKLEHAIQSSIHAQTGKPYTFVEFDKACSFPTNTTSRIMSNKEIPTSTQVNKINSVLGLTGLNRVIAPPKAKLIKTIIN